ncbi:MAG: V4R domain-containing protein [Candidatus Aenigmatarchaeota archaeon]
MEFPSWLLTIFGPFSLPMLFSSIITAVGMIVGGIFIWRWYKKFYGIAPASFGSKLLYAGLLLIGLQQLLEVPFTYNVLGGTGSLVGYQLLELVSAVVLFGGFWLLEGERLAIEDELGRILKKEHIRKEMPDTVNLKLPRMLVQSLQWISVGYASALYFAGKKLGAAIIAKELPSGLKPMLNAVGNIFMDLGMGRLEVVDVSATKAIVRLYEGSTAYGMKPINKPVCFFESGLIAGALEAKLKNKVMVNEVLCGGLGDKYEEFVVRIG